MKAKKSMTLGGLHHVTAIAGPPRDNLAFYVGTLGLRLVKKTVNFDDPATYHLYYGDTEGRPGSILTFFPWTYASQGHTGTGMVAATTFEVPLGSIAEWADRLGKAGANVADRQERFGEEVLPFHDPDGLPLELAATSRASQQGGNEGIGVRGFHSVTLDVAELDDTAQLLGDIFAFRVDDESDGRLRFRTDRSSRADVIDVLKGDGSTSGRPGVGTVHHIAFRVDSEQEQLEWRDRLDAAGYRVTPVQDRQYFKSIYFREPGGILFEIATDPPGFTLDESLDELGTMLKLPPWLEPRRVQIEAYLEHLPTPSR